MKAIVRSVYGSPDVLELVEVALPTVAPDGVLVRVQASSLNAADLDYLYGRPFLTKLGTGLRSPRNRGLGLDAAGVVETVGAEVTRFKPGDAVFGDLTQYGYGAFAEYACAPERAWQPMPAGMSFEAAATIPQAAILALQSLQGPRPIGPGDRVLVNGASGNVGPFAVQIAKAFGARVTGVCRTDKVDFVVRPRRRRRHRLHRRGLHPVGAALGLDRRRRRQPPDPRDRGARSGRGGVYAWSVGRRRGSSGRSSSVPSISLAGSRSMGLMMSWRPFKPSDVAILTGLIEAGTLTPVIDRTYPLSEVPDALRYLDAGRARGKIVITI